jgi:hypothetical protein
MDNIGNSSQPQNDLDKPIPLGDDIPKPSGPASGPVGVSRAPLNLGGGGKPPAAAPTPAAPRVATPAPVVKRAPATAAPAERITGVKTFYTKLHPGAIEFLDEQVASWLKDNPNASIKQVTVTTGEVQAKKTEPNIIVNIWY